MSFKHLFSKSLSAAPERLHFAAHSHHLWPDASYDGQVECWDDAARLADNKWDRIMGEVWPFAAGEVAREIGAGSGESIVFSANTHDFILRLAAACPKRDGEPLRILTSDGEFHSARRQLLRWEEAGEVEVTRINVEPFESFATRFRVAAESGGHDLIFVSQVLFGSGRVTEGVNDIAALGKPEGPWVVIDGYHAFMAISQPLGETAAKTAFYLGGGYKYAMSGEGMGFMHCPPGFGPRPPLTGWFAEFDDLSLPPGMVGYAPDAMRFMGATFDASSLYRFGHVRRMLGDEGLDTVTISAHVAGLQAEIVEGMSKTRVGEAELLNPLDGKPHARFLAFRHANASTWKDALMAKGCVTDVRGEVIRFGVGLYHDEEDVRRLVALAGEL